jgi:ATP-dependent phosphofructokinase / diphosphate-dependent phosphofructokinase
VVRAVDMTKPAYKVAREYMIRLEREDFENREHLEALARAASSPEKQFSPSAFRAKFEHAVTELRGSL